MFLEVRELASLNPQPEKWKSEFWDSSLTEPAMIRFPVVIFFYLFLWGINIWILDRSHLQYYGVIGVKSGHLSYTFFTAIFFTILYTIHLTLARDMFKMTTEVTLVTFYILVLICSLSYFPGGENRAHFFRILRQIIFPGPTVTFPEVLVADALCSLSKPFKDFGLTLIIFYSHILQNNLSPINFHNTGMIFIAILASIPFVLRIRQCSVQYNTVSDPSNKLPILLNIIKYFSSFPPIWLAALASLGYFHPLLPSITAFMATINSIYSFLWDIIMDWGLLALYSTPPAPTSPLSSPNSHRPKTIFSFSLHLLISILNLLLRFSWAANRISGLSSLSSSQLVLIIELAEVFRRAVWNIFRIEWEINQTEKNLHLKNLSSKL